MAKLQTFDFRILISKGGCEGGQKLLPASHPQPRNATTDAKFGEKIWLRNAIHKRKMAPANIRATKGTQPVWSFAFGLPK